jgi:hypothetical protein
MEFLYLINVALNHFDQHQLCAMYIDENMTITNITDRRRNNIFMTFKCCEYFLAAFCLALLYSSNKGSLESQLLVYYLNVIHTYYIMMIAPRTYRDLQFRAACVLEHHHL